MMALKKVLKKAWKILMALTNPSIKMPMALMTSPSLLQSPLSNRLLRVKEKWKKSLRLNQRRMSTSPI